MPQVKESYIQPVSFSENPIVQPSVISPTPEKVMKELSERGVKGLLITGTLHGGYMSHVYKGVLNGKNVVVKQTNDIHPKDPTAFFIGREVQNTDAHVLSLLEDSENVRVPKIINHFPDITTTIMEDLGQYNFLPFMSHIQGKSLTVDSARPIGTAMAHLTRESRSWTQFDTDQSALQSIYDRGLELRVAYPNGQKEYLALQEKFLTQNTGWVWVDGTPKNILLDPNSNPAFVDFGISCFGDQQHTLPGFLSHIAVYSLAGFIEPQVLNQYLDNAIDSYAKVDFIDEVSFTQYFGMEVLHRAMGKRIPGITETQQKLMIMELGLRIFDENVESIGGLIALLRKIQNGKQ